MFTDHKLVRLAELFDEARLEANKYEETASGTTGAYRQAMLGLKRTLDIITQRPVLSELAYNKILDGLSVTEALRAVSPVFEAKDLFTLNRLARKLEYSGHDYDANLMREIRDRYFDEDGNPKPYDA